MHMRNCKLSIATVVIGLSAFSLTPALAGAMDDMPGMAHHHHNDGPPPGEQLGLVSFPTSCAPASQAAIARGVALLHSFGYTKARQQFEAITKSDPACAMAHWGVAMSQYHELWGHPDDTAFKLGAAETATARSLASASPGATPREHTYIDALSAFFDPADLKFGQRAEAYEAKMNALHTAFPDDVEGAAFDALAILAATAPTDTTLTHQHQALAILVPLFAAHPHHPGLAHYIIHTCDTPALAEDGLGAARAYAKIAAASPHALHMPGHIFARLGLWKEDIASNLASVVASKTAEAAGQPGAAHQMHADEFLIYAYLQIGEVKKAEALTGQMATIGKHMAEMPGMDDMKDDGAFFDSELRAILAMETHRWQRLAALTPEAGARPYDTYDIYWGQGVAAGHLRDPKLAAAALANFDKSMDAERTSPTSSDIPSLEIKRDELLGWQAFAEDRPADAVTALRKAADQQDKLGQEEVDIPAREMLGDLLLLEHQPVEALAAYREALKLSPNRLNGLRGAAEAARQAGHADEAAMFEKAAVKQVRGADLAKS
jgi:tetratricopeptide (TPR) repeat protein